ncbi:MAG TPA: hypothetical protein VKU01_01105 [Bryobacteraceae bacterium]|nr:hypothetical protein [Bryobacteraceae bacterium]
MRSSHTIMVTHANGSSGYIPNDDVFEPISYEITTSQTTLRGKCNREWPAGPDE